MRYKPQLSLRCERSVSLTVFPLGHVHWANLAGRICETIKDREPGDRPDRVAFAWLRDWLARYCLREGLRSKRL